jgi:hypothetical protein
MCKLGKCLWTDVANICQMAYSKLPNIYHQGAFGMTPIFISDIVNFKQWIQHVNNILQ